MLQKYSVQFSYSWFYLLLFYSLKKKLKKESEQNEEASENKTITDVQCSNEKDQSTFSSDK